MSGTTRGGWGTSIPFFGPEAGEVEPVGIIDVISKGTALTLIAVLLRRYWQRPRLAAG